MPNGVSPPNAGPLYTGFHIVRLDEPPGIESDSLADIARHHGLRDLGAFLDDREITSTRRAIVGVSRAGIRRLEARAMKSGFEPINSVASYYRLDVRHRTDHVAELANLADVPGVAHAYPELKVIDPGPIAGANPYSAEQGYLAAAPAGINALWAWNTAGVNGDSIRVVDLEQGWLKSHPDLPKYDFLYGNNRDGIDGYVGNHGAAVLGEIAAVDNDIGVIGIAPGISKLGVASHYDGRSGTEGHVADAICAVLDSGYLRPGDVLMLEVQRVHTHALPTEVDPLDLDAILLARAHDIIVVEAAGNGGQDLDTWTDAAGKRQFDLTNAAFVDSGAIFVGSANSAVTGIPRGHRRYSSSNYGGRVDCYAWGDNVVTTGYGDLDLGSGDIAGYTGDFEETSAATPIVAGAAAIVQSKYKADTGSVLLPDQVRRLLSDPRLGTPQHGGASDPVGVMPDLKKIIKTGLPVLSRGRKMKTSFHKVYGPLLAAVLLVLYVVLVWNMIAEIMECGRAVANNGGGCEKVPFPEGISNIVTLIGGLISALVVAHLAKAEDARSLVRIYLGPQPNPRLQRWLPGLIGAYIFVWFVVGLASLFVAVIMYPGVKNVVAEIGTGWLGVALASVYAYLGLRSS